MTFVNKGQPFCDLNIFAVFLLNEHFGSSNSFFQTSSTSPIIPTICGQNTGQHGKTKRMWSKNVLTCVNILSKKRPLVVFFH